MYELNTMHVHTFTTQTPAVYETHAQKKRRQEMGSMLRIKSMRILTINQTLNIVFCFGNFTILGIKMGLQF